MLCHPAQLLKHWHRSPAVTTFQQLWLLPTCCIPIPHLLRASVGEQEGLGLSGALSSLCFVDLLSSTCFLLEQRLAALSIAAGSLWLICSASTFPWL